MRSPNIYTYTIAQIIDDRMEESAPAKYNIGNLLTASRSGRLMLQKAMLDVGYDKCRALLTQAAMENTATLATMTAQLSQIAPHASGYYLALLDAYARKAVDHIERW